MPKQNIHLALFDVRPRRGTGELNVARVVNLRPEKALSKKTPIIPEKPPIQSAVARQSITAQLLGSAPRATGKDIVAKEVEEALGQLTRTEEADEELKNFWSPATRETDEWLKKIKSRPYAATPPLKKSVFSGIFTRRAILVTVFGILAVSGISAAAFASSELIVKKEADVLRNSASAISNLQEAKTNLQEFDFAAAADNFALAYDDFDKASKTLNRFGASLLSVFGNIPGLGKVKSARDLAQAGQNISKAGESLSRAFRDLYTTNLFGFLVPYDSARGGRSLAQPIGDFQRVLEVAKQNVDRAHQLLSGVDSAVIPQDKRAAFDSSLKQIPLFQAYIGQAIDYSDFLLGVVGTRTAKTYLVLFQNTSEKRPTGGFPGTYAIVSFDRGTLRKIFVDDIYNPDGQIRANMIPPAPLQHITPNWGLRDVNWFADFPTTARKVQEYYKLDGGGDLDGVFSVTPTVIKRILAIIGPIEMPEYGVTLTADNVLAELQGEIEHGENHAQPKKIVTDFQPLLFQKLAQTNREQWISIVKMLFDALNEKHILAYFNDSKLQRETLENGFAGELKKAKGDYLQIAFSNVKGAKTDAVTANSMRLSVDLAGPERTHALSITRLHQGGNSRFSFYNRDNSSYVKIYAPPGSVLISADGFSKPAYSPLISHKDLGFKPDPDLAAVESTISHPIDGVDVFEESGKTVFGFWVITKPQNTSTATLVYRTPSVWQGIDQDKYELFWQKQSGGEDDRLQVSVKLPERAVVLNSTDGAQLVGGTIVYQNDLTIDRDLKVVYH